MKSIRTYRLGKDAGFTLVELLVSTALIAVISLLLVTTTNSTASAWRHTTGRIEQFRGADAAFEAITRRLSQATLNTYWDYFDVSGNAKTPSNAATFKPHHYGRQSELRFIAGTMTTGARKLLTTTTPRRPTQGVFFQAPLGYVSDAPGVTTNAARTNFSGLGNLINTWGYYVEFNRDVRPKFIDQLPNPPPLRYRYRLMELTQPSNLLTIYGTDSGSKPYNAGRKWFTDPITPTGSDVLAPSVHAVAENVIALVLLPKLSKKEDTSGTQLAKDFFYDSAPAVPPKAVQLITEHQLPPIVQVTMVAIDEASASRIAKGATPPGFDATLDTLFTNAKEEQFAADLETLRKTLVNAKPPISYRIFTSNVGIRGAKWSRK